MTTGRDARVAVLRTRVLALGCALLLLAGCTAGAPPKPPAPAPQSVVPSVTTSVEVDGRRVLLHLPSARPDGTAAALVVVLHGYTGDAAGAVQFFGLRALADERGVVVAAPQGAADREGNAFWNAARACCDFGGSAVDDSTFLSRVISTVVETRAVDPGRVYVVGHSNGGFMAHRLACEHAHQVAAIASLAGALDEDSGCRPARPVSVLQVHGTADDTILYEGGRINGQRYTSAAGTVGWWRRADGCRGAGRTGSRLDGDARVPGNDLTPTSWGGCRDDTTVALWRIADGSHVPVLTPAFTTALLDWLEANRRRS